MAIGTALLVPHVTPARLDQVPEAVVVPWARTRSLCRADPVLVEHSTLFSLQPGTD